MVLAPLLGNVRNGRLTGLTAVHLQKDVHPSATVKRLRRKIKQAARNSSLMSDPPQPPPFGV